MHRGRRDDLKTRIGTERIDVTVGSAAELDRTARTLDAFAANPPGIDRESLVVTVPVHEGVRLMQVMRALDHDSIDAIDVHRREASLDDVFLSLTDDKTPEEAA